MSAMLSARKAAALCGVSEKTVRRWIAAGRIKADKGGRDFRIPLSELSALRGPGAASSADVRGPDTGLSGAGAARDAAEWAALVRDLQAQVVQHAAAAAMWQTRAEVLGQRLLALEAPPLSSAVEDNEPAPAPEPPTPRPDGQAGMFGRANNPAPWWRRWWLWLMHEPMIDCQ
jgi:excisionase family DNA binding protein